MNFHNSEDESTTENYSSSIDDSSSSDEDAIAISVNNRARLIALSLRIQDPKEIRKRRVIQRHRAEGASRLWKHYFDEEPTFTDEIFRRRFRMNHDLFNRIIAAVVANNRYFLQKNDALGLPGLTPHQKITAAIRMLAYGCAADAIDESVRIGETTIMKSLRQFCKSIVDVFGDQYMRSPTESDVARLLEENAERGFPGMLGSVDCMHWHWKNCPTSYAGMYTGHARSPTIVLEEVASYDTWFWHAFFGMPGSNNDLNVLHRSYLFRDLMNGRAPPANYIINNNRYTMGYYLADGIYPELATIVKTIKHPVGNQNIKLSEMQESCRNDVERAFRVLQARFAIVKIPARVWNPDVMSYIMKTCIILHNMIVEDERRRPGYWPTDTYDQGRYSEPVTSSRRWTADLSQNRMVRQSQIYNSDAHYALREDLVQHIWRLYGRSG